MTNREALERAERALQKAYKNSEYFDHGGLASHEIMDIVNDALREEFLRGIEVCIPIRSASRS